VNEKLEFLPGTDSARAVAEKLLSLEKHYTIDAASVIIRDKTGEFRLPMISPEYEKFAYRDMRELESERFMLNVQGTLYEVGRESGYIAIRPVTTHKKKLVDLCTWRGLLVLSGTRQGAVADGHYFAGAGADGGLWFGAVDDLWKMGKPSGEGGVWKDAAVEAGAVSLPMLMTGYERKTVTLSSDVAVDIELEVDFDLTGFHSFKTIHVPAGRTVTYSFPVGFNAHWVRAKAGGPGKVTVWFKYE
jgi:hypothetical protein